MAMMLQLPFSSTSRTDTPMNGLLSLMYSMSVWRAPGSILLARAISAYSSTKPAEIIPVGMATAPTPRNVMTTVMICPSGVMA